MTKEEIDEVLSLNPAIMKRVGNMLHNTKRAKELTDKQLIDQLIRVWGEMSVDSWDSAVLDCGIKKLQSSGNTAKMYLVTIKGECDEYSRDFFFAEAEKEFFVSNIIELIEKLGFQKYDENSDTYLKFADGWFHVEIQICEVKPSYNLEELKEFFKNEHVLEISEGCVNIEL